MMRRCMASHPDPCRRSPDSSVVPEAPSRSEWHESQGAAFAGAASEDSDPPLVQQFVAAWEARQCTSVEQFLADQPLAATDPQLAVRLIYEEFCLRQEAGDAVEPASVLARFPQWRAELQLVLEWHASLQIAGVPPTFPVAGERIGEFQLLAELGRGAEGRVFLATQPSLSDRPVVLKLVPRKGAEHLALARLQHTSIVPLYFVTDDPQRNLRVLCMPYLGGVTLARLLELLAERSLAGRTGNDFVVALQRARAEAPVAVPLDGPVLQFLPHASYVQGVCWIGACLADALQYAHGRGLVHLDIKPSNVLLAADGQPMLLDFHLAREVVMPGRLAGNRLGGTPGYLSPEQAQAITAVRQLRPVPAVVDGRSDIYSLGLLLYELLGGPPWIAAGEFRVPTRDEFDPSVPRRVVAVIQKCLASEPGQRFADATTLALALRRLLVAPPSAALTVSGSTPSFGSRRNPAKRSVAMTAVVLAVALLGTTAVHFGGRGDRDTPGHLGGQVRLEQAAALRQRTADEIHALVDQLRFLDGIESMPADRLRTLATGCRTVWQGRHQWTSQTRGELAADTERRLRADWLELAILWADLHVRLASAEQLAQARREALQVLTQAEAEFGRSVVLSTEQRAYAEALGLASEAERAARAAAQLAPQTVWEHYAVGRARLRAGDLEEAATELSYAVEIEPQAFWPNFYAGICAYRRHDYEVALASFSACVALAPDQAEGFHNRGLVYRVLGRDDLAACDFACARHRDTRSRR